MFNLRRIRLKNGYTCESLGALVGVGKSTMAKYERGEVQPSNDVLLKLSETLNCTIDYLLGKSDTPDIFESEKDDKDVVVLRRNFKKMSLEQREKAKNLLKISFEDFEWDD